jgi:hypothetical protein
MPVDDALRGLRARLPGRLQRLLPYFAYAVAFLAGGLLVEATLTVVPPVFGTVAMFVLILLGVVPGAVMLARRLGAPTVRGMLVTGLMLALLGLAFLVLFWAAHGGAQAIAFFFRHASGVFVGSVLVEILAPPAWLLVLQRLERRPASTPG